MVSGDVISSFFELLSQSLPPSQPSPTLHWPNQGQARGYGHITQQYLILGRTTGGQHLQLEYLQRYLKNCFASFIL